MCFFLQFCFSISSSVFYLGGSMLASSACTFLLLLSFSQGAVICWQCLFYGVSVAAWNGLEVISVELYPSSKRYSATASNCENLDLYHSCSTTPALLKCFTYSTTWLSAYNYKRNLSNILHFACFWYIWYHCLTEVVIHLICTIKMCSINH